MEALKKNPLGFLLWLTYHSVIRSVQTAIQPAGCKKRMWKTTGMLINLKKQVFSLCFAAKDRSCPQLWAIGETFIS